MAGVGQVGTRFSTFAQAFKEATERELARPRGYGCVTNTSQGSHEDMDASLLRTSVNALLHSWQQEEWNIETFAQLRGIGVRAEQAMLAATNGINTHKGLNFLTLFLLHAWMRSIPWDGLTEYIADFSKPLLEDYKKSPDTEGLRWAKEGGHDIRQWPLTGFEGLLIVAEQLQRAPMSDDALSLYLIANIEDTTTIHRGDRTHLQYVQRQARDILVIQEEGFYSYAENQAQKLDAYYQQHGLSSGGVADLFSILRLLEALYEEWQ